MKEEGKKANMSRAKEDLTSQNYSIEDKNMRDADDKYSRRGEDRYNGPTTKFSEKEGKWIMINRVAYGLLEQMSRML